MSQQQYHPPTADEESAPSLPPRRPEQQSFHSPAPPPTPPMPQQYHPPSSGTEMDPTMSQQQHFPPAPPGPSPPQYQNSSYQPDEQQNNPYNPKEYADKPMGDSHLYPPPPKRNANRYSGEQDITSPVHYSRDPKKLVAYLIPFPKPLIPDVPPESIPTRFLIYTPPPPPFLDKPKEGEKEGKIHKAQRKWADEIREAKTTNPKLMSWKGAKGKAIQGINWGMSQTKSSNLEFLNRIGGGPAESQHENTTESDQEEQQGQNTVKLEEMLLIYPSSLNGTPEEIREEFINTMLRSKSKAQRDAVIATGLLPVSLGIDVMATFIWPFGGLLEIDSVWAYASFRGAKNARSVTKRLTASNQTGGKGEEDKLHLNFTPSPRLAVLDRYLAHLCHMRAADMFPNVGLPPTETECLEAIGWFPSSKGGVERNWEDEQWEISEVKDDFKSNMTKGSKEWEKWVRLFAKDPEKAMKK